MRAPKLLIWLLAVQLLVGGAFVFAVSQDFFTDGDASVREDASRELPRRFDERRAFALLREQVEDFGPRPAGSDASRRLAARLRRLLPGGRFEPLPRDLDPSGRLRNVVGRIPGSKPAVVIGAHYDTEAEPRGHVGANDGAAGTAAVVELARTLRRAKRRAGAPELRFVLFDGEEEPAGCTDFARCGIRGSRAYVRAHGDEVGGLILLDYVGEKGLRVPREGSSDIELWGRLRSAARRVGKGVTFPDEVGASLIDDHTPFLEAGITAIDLIDFEYPYRDTVQDTVDKTSAASLDAVGESVAQLVLALRSGRL